MKNGSYFIPRERIHSFMNPSAMNNAEGLCVIWETDPAIARRVLPPPLDLSNPLHPVVFAYATAIREPTFAPWYMEAGLSLFCRYRETAGIYYLNLQLTGPGALMALCSGREFSGLPKKLADRIVVERTDDCARAYVERHGRRILDVEAVLGTSHDPALASLYPSVGAGSRKQDSCLLFQYQPGNATDGRMTLPRAYLLNYDSVTEYRTWEPGRIESIRLEPSLDDPWAELVVAKPLGAVYTINSNCVSNVSPIAEFNGDDADALFSYLFSGRWDRSTICAGHQRYE